MRNGTTRNGGSGGEGQRGDRAQRSAGQDQVPDLETQILDEMESSGRTSVVPRAGLVGAHQQRNASLVASIEADEPGEPAGGGSDVAPTRQAELRERERHQLQREMGVVPAGQENLRQQRAPGVTRESLDQVAPEADRRGARLAQSEAQQREQQQQRQRELDAPAGTWQSRAGGWLRENRVMVAGLGGAALVSLLLAANRRR